MIFGATYRASGNHERTCVSEVVSADAAGLSSLTLIAFGRRAARETEEDSVISIGDDAVTSTVWVTAPISRTTEKTARSPWASDISRLAVLKPSEETWISTLPAESPARANPPSPWDVNV